MICNSCGGVVGRDCFNPQECAEIGHRQEQEQRQQALSLEDRVAALEARVTELEHPS